MDDIFTFAEVILSPIANQIRLKIILQQFLKKNPSILNVSIIGWDDQVTKVI